MMVGFRTFIVLLFLIRMLEEQLETRCLPLKSKPMGSGFRGMVPQGTKPLKGCNALRNVRAAAAMNGVSQQGISQKVQHIREYTLNHIKNPSTISKI